MSCLLIKNDGLGDLILASGLISDLARERAPLDLVTCEANREVAAAIPGVRRVLYVSRDSLWYSRLAMRFGLRFVRGSRGDHAVLRELRSGDYDEAVCLRRYIRQSSLLLMRNVRARRRHCAWLFPTNASPELAESMSRGWERYRGPRQGSELSYYRGFVHAALGVRSVSAPVLETTRGSRPAPREGHIGLVIGGLSTNWPQVHWIDLARELRRAGKRLWLFGGQDAAGLAAEVVRAVPDATNLVGTLSLSESVQPLGGLEMVIGNDTGMTHFASLVAAKVLVVLGGGTFGRFFPWPETGNQFVIFKGMDCYDCNWQCRHPSRRCLDELPWQAVLEFGFDVLQGRAERARNLGEPVAMP